MSQFALHQYQEYGIQSGVIASDPHRLVLMLFEGILKNIAIAKGFMQRKDLMAKGRHISKAIDIIGHLLSSLNHEVDSELPGQLSSLYTYMMERLVYANYRNNENILDEVAHLVTTIKTGWEELPYDIRAQFARGNTV